MSKWNSLRLTAKGINLLAKIRSGTSIFEFTKIKTGEGAPLVSDSIESMLDLISAKQTLQIDSAISKSGSVILSSILSNSNLSNEYDFKELGVYANDPDEGEILYAYTYDIDPDTMPSANTTIIRKKLEIVLGINNTGNVLIRKDEHTGIPVGFITLELSNTIDDGYLEFDGSELNREVYSDLWEYIQTKPELLKSEDEWQTINTTDGNCKYFSTGDNETTFRLPNYSPSVGKYVIKAYGNITNIGNLNLGKYLANTQVVQERTKLKKLGDYLYRYDTDSLDYESAKKHFEEVNLGYFGGCTSVRNGNFYGRNYDWLYNNEVEFVVRTLKTTTHHASIGIAGGLADLTKDFVESNRYSDAYSLVPFMLLDGINDQGLVANMNVVPMDLEQTTMTVPAIEEREKVCILMIIRYILDNFSTAESACEYIKNYVAVYHPIALSDMHYEIHIMVADKDKTLCIEFKDNETIILDMSGSSSDNVSGKPYMTNFHLHPVEFNDDGKVYTPADTTLNSSNNAIDVNHVTPNGSGLERYNYIVENYNTANTLNGMRNLMNSLLYSYTYKITTNPFWYTEFVGIPIDDTSTLNTGSPSSEYDSRIDIYLNKFTVRDRVPGSAGYGTWHTAHSCVYDIEHKSIYIISQEEIENTIIQNLYLEFDNNTDSIQPEIDLSGIYTKTEIDSLLNNKVNNSDLNNYITSSDVNNLLKNKANKNAPLQPWKANTQYASGDQVVNNNNIYECILGNQDASFNSAKWKVISGGNSEFGSNNIFVNVPKWTYDDNGNLIPLLDDEIDNNFQEVADTISEKIINSDNVTALIDARVDDFISTMYGSTLGALFGGDDGIPTWNSTEMCLIEHGSNMNGEYWVLSNKIVICKNTIELANINVIENDVVFNTNMWNLPYSASSYNITITNATAQSSNNKYIYLATINDAEQGNIILWNTGNTSNMLPGKAIRESSEHYTITKAHIELIAIGKIE